MSESKASVAFVDGCVRLDGLIESIFWAPEFPMGPNIGVVLTPNLKI